VNFHITCFLFIDFPNLDDSANEEDVNNNTDDPPAQSCAEKVTVQKVKRKQPCESASVHNLVIKKIPRLTVEKEQPEQATSAHEIVTKKKQRWEAPSAAVHEVLTKKRPRSSHDVVQKLQPKEHKVDRRSYKKHGFARNRIIDDSVSETSKVEHDDSNSESEQSLMMSILTAQLLQVHILNAHQCVLNGVRMNLKH